MSRHASLPPFAVPRPVIGVAHLLALPGAPGHRGSLELVLSRLLDDVAALSGGGVDGIIVENFGDVPFYRDVVPPETVASMTRAVRAVCERVSIPVGVNVLRNDAHAALAVAAATGASFIRVNVHVGAAWTDQGLVVGRAHETIRRRAVLAPGVPIFADISVKHAAPVTPRPLEEEALDCLERGKADSVIVTGHATGAAADLDALRRLRQALPDAPVLVGSGVSLETVRSVLELADGVIVGTAFKADGRVQNPVDVDRVRSLVARAREARTDVAGT